MRREFVPFDGPAIDSEFTSLAAAEKARLAYLISRVEKSPVQISKPILIEDYANDIRCLRDENTKHQGRCLFFVAESRKDYQKLVIVRIYKKETAKVPSAILKTAMERKERWREANQKKK